MSTDAALFVERLRGLEREPEYMIFVSGNGFENNDAFTTAVKKSCGRSKKGFEISYYIGLSPDEFIKRFKNYPPVNFLFARTKEELESLTKQFGIVEERFEEVNQETPIDRLGSQTNYLSGWLSNNAYLDIPMWIQFLIIVCLVVATIIVILPIGLFYIAKKNFKPVIGLYNYIFNQKKPIS